MTDKNNDDLKHQASENTLGLNPVIGIRGKDLLSSARVVLKQALKQPLHSAKHLAHFSMELKNVMLGQSDLTPADGDRRFADPAWSQNPLYRRYLQTYLAWRKELHDWVEHSNLSEQDASRGHFVINLMTEAMAPSNSMANPAAVKRFFETGGKSLLDGLSHLAQDIVNNGGMPSQVNMNAFEVGKSLATTDGAVIFRNDLLELIQYKPITEQVHERPLLVVPPQINKFYVFDLSPEKSVARFLLRNGIQTFVVSWRNPTKAHREWGLSTYIEALKEAIDVVTAVTGSKDINMLGACSGGLTTTSLLGHYAALGEKKVHALTLLVSVLDNRLETDVALFADEKSLEMAKRRSYRAGALEVCGTPIDLKQVTSDLFCVAGTTDHITPWESCYKSANLFGGNVEFVLSNSGHIQSILNPPGNPKARYMTNTQMHADPKTWQASSTKHADSWWLHWQVWLSERSGAHKKAPTQLGNKKYPAGEAAPGTYVHER